MKQPKKPQPKSPPTAWSPVAEWYDNLVGQAGSEFHQEVIFPNVLRLLQFAPSQSLVDIACGQGAFCRLAQSKGAIVTGIDASADLIKLAKARGTEPRTPNPEPSYHIADARDLSFLPADQFHAAVCILAIQNIHPIAPVFTSVSRILRPSGRFILVMMHPCFRGPKETSWGWDEKQNVQYRRVDRYLLPRKSPIVTHPGQSTQYTWSFHKPIEAYVRGLRNAGLLVDAMEEWPSHKTSTSGPRAASENIARKEIPMFLAIRAIKVAGLPATSETESDAETS